MSITVKKVALAEQESVNEGSPVNKNYLGLVSSLEVQCTVRIGTLTMSIAQLSALSVGQALHLEQKTDEPIELMVHDKVIAKGELMTHEDYFAVQITQVCC